MTNGTLSWFSGLLAKYAKSTIRVHTQVLVFQSRKSAISASPLVKKAVLPPLLKVSRNYFP